MVQKRKALAKRNLKILKFSVYVGDHPLKAQRHFWKFRNYVLRFTVKVAPWAFDELAQDFEDWAHAVLDAQDDLSRRRAMQGLIKVVQQRLDGIAKIIYAA